MLGQTTEILKTFEVKLSGQLKVSLWDEAAAAAADGEDNDGDDNEDGDGEDDGDDDDDVILWEKI